MLRALGTIVKVLAAYELGIQAQSWVSRASVTAQAREAAKQAGKPVLVLTPPKPQSLMGMGMYLAGMESCPIEVSRGLVEYLASFNDKEFGAVQLDGVLESSDQPGRVFQEARRISDRVFISGPSSMSVVNWLHPGHQNVVLSGPPSSDELVLVSMRGRRKELSNAHA